MTKPGPGRPSIPDGFGYANPFFGLAAFAATFAGYGQHRRWSSADVTVDHRNALREAYAGRFADAPVPFVNDRERSGSRGNDRYHVGDWYRQGPPPPDGDEIERRCAVAQGISVEALRRRRRMRGRP